MLGLLVNWLLVVSVCTLVAGLLIPIYERYFGRIALITKWVILLGVISIVGAIVIILLVLIPIPPFPPIPYGI